MHKELVVKTPSLAGSTELLVIAPIKPGFVPALDAVTYTSRARLLLRTLHGGRRNAHEYNPFRAVSDAVERVGVIHTLRVAVLDPDAANPAGSILLSVNFDGAYEAYVRTIWQKAARLLDLIFCNTVGHVTGWDHSYEAWSRWLQSRQIDTPFYYGAPALTKGDVTALRMQDRFQRRAAGTDLLITQTSIVDAEHIAWELVQNSRDPQSGPFAQDAANAQAPGEREGVRQGLQGLAGVYRLTDLYTPGTPDGALLHHAAHELLPEFVRMWESGKYDVSIRDAAGERLHKALLWLVQPPALPAVREKPALPVAEPALPANAQAGVLQPIDPAQRACVCLVAFDSPADGAAFLRAFPPTAQAQHTPGAACTNVALTFGGLRACGVPERVLDRLPIEFRQGMQQRAGLLGDVQANHPRRWLLPLLNWPAAVDDPAAPAPVDAPTVALEAVHALLHVRVADTSEQDLAQMLKARFAGLGAGVRPLSVQWLRRNFDTEGQVVDHFGYADGHSEPVFGPDDAFSYPNQVHLGEALVGHPNAADAPPVLGADLGPLLQDASYLVVRKLRQDVAAFDAAVAAVGLPADLVKAKMMGRAPDGTPLVPSDGPNDFNYDDDPAGALCPFAAHIRRANPRVSDGVQSNEVQALPGARPPRLFRRGMSYTDREADGGDDKGLFFMAYNASIGEQFEVVQRWLAGGNSSGAPSGAADPICGVPEVGRRRFFRFENAGTVVRMALDGDDELGVEPEPLVRLAWGAYFLTPSLDGVAHLASLAEAAAAHAQASAVPVPWSVAEGLATIARLQALGAGAGADAALEAWKAALEDPESRREFQTASVWAAVREAHGGLLRTPYGVLVADDKLVRQILTDVEARTTVAGYQERLTQSIGPIFLGLDAGPEYDRQALACNGAIEKLTFDDGYHRARGHTQVLLQAWMDDAQVRAHGYGEARWELNLDIRDLTERVLARLLEDWFGLSTAGNHLMPAGFDWAFSEQEPARYPGAFYTPSRHTFQPQPTETVLDTARRHGRHLRQQMTRFLQEQDAHIAASTVTRAVLDDPGLRRNDGTKDYDLAARTIAGAIMGFVPTTDNNLRRIVDQWLRDQTMWQLRARTGAGTLATPAAGRAALAEPIHHAMMLRPMPEFIWRTALDAHVLPTTDGGVFHVQQGDRLVLGLVSATQQGLEQGLRNVVPVFGGNRWASPAPRHACPGMPSAMGVMAGLLSAIVDAAQTLRPTTATGILCFEGPVTAPAPAAAAVAEVLPLDLSSGEALAEDAFASEAEAIVTTTTTTTVLSFQDSDTEPTTALFARTMVHTLEVHGADLTGGPGLAQAAAVAAARTLLAWGDSWFHLQHPLSFDDWDLARSLADLGWNTRGFAAYSTEGLTLQEMATVARRTGFYRLVHQQKPDAVLIDGGGNDVHKSNFNVPSSDPRYGRSPLHDLAAPAGSLPRLNPQAVADFVHGQLRRDLDTVLANLIDVTRGAIPIFVHGYDHPIPDGRTFLFGDKWLDPLNILQRYTRAQGAEVMQLLIDELNTMIANAVQPFAAHGVRHLKLTGTLAAQPGYATNYKDWWLNELHPTRRGYDILAAVCDEAISTVLAAARA